MTQTTLQPRLRLRLLGPLAVSRDGSDVELPPSRKVRALLAYLAMSATAQGREHLCDLLGDIADDPRGELRWCLSKLRAVVDEGDRQRLCSRDDCVSLDLRDCEVDALEVGRPIDAGVATLDAAQLDALAARFAGDFMASMHLDRSPHLNQWLAAQRRRFRACRVAILERRVGLAVARGEAGGAALESWLQLAPFDLHAHQRLLQQLAAHGQITEGEQHLALTAAAFEAEGLDCTALRAAWLAARPRPEGTPATASAPAAPVAPRGDSQDSQDSHDSIDAAARGAKAARRASIAVMPFVEWPASESPRGGLADGLAHDIITRLAKLRSLFVIAQGSVFALHERRIGAEEAGRTLGVDYLVSGSLQRRGGRIVVHCELAQARTAQIVWAEVFEQPLDESLQVLDAIGNRIVALLASEIETLEAERAVLVAPSSLDAWQAHHRGLWHMYRFEREHNQRARHYFELAVRLDPHFSRAHAGLSFTHWQDAFQRWMPRDEAVAKASASAERSLRADERDPAARWSMGRALWLRGQRDPALTELRAAVELSPNFALGHYTLSFVHCQTGDPGAAIEASDHARHLSPFDPLLFGMLGARAMALVRLGRYDEAAEWGVRAASRPNAHVQIQAIAAMSLALAGRLDEAREHVDRARAFVGSYRAADYLAAFSFPAETRSLYARAAATIGFA
jgi:TolB-like protein/DNA-binding SARP family transcriptional activator